VRKAYVAASRKYRVPWNGRHYDRERWEGGDPINRALSAANALLNGLCHAAIVSREYGIPCVVCVDGATSLIPDGSTVRICGTTGEVTVLAGPSR